MSLVKSTKKMSGKISNLRENAEIFPSMYLIAENHKLSCDLENRLDRVQSMNSVRQD